MRGAGVEQGRFVSGQSPGNGGELTAWKTKLLSHLIGVEEARIPLGISLGHWSDFLQRFICVRQSNT